MNSLQVAKYLESKKDYLFPNDKYSAEEVEAALMAAPNHISTKLDEISFKNPRIAKLLAVFPGQIGIDRFYLGDIGMGILKYCTFGGVGILWIADICSAKKRCKRKNCIKLMEWLQKVPQEVAVDDGFDLDFMFGSEAPDDGKA